MAWNSGSEEPLLGLGLLLGPGPCYCQYLNPSLVIWLTLMSSEILISVCRASAGANDSAVIVILR